MYVSTKASIVHDIRPIGAARVTEQTMFDAVEHSLITLCQSATTKVSIGSNLRRYGIMLTVTVYAAK